MYQDTVIFTGHSAFQVDTRFGQKTKNVFTDTQSREFQVWKADIAAQLLASMGQQVTVQFEAKQNGQYTNYDVKGIIGGVVGAPAVTAATPAPSAPAQAAPPPQAQVGETQDQKQLRIMRQNAIGNAVLAFGAAGIDPVENSAELLEFAQEVLLDFYINGFSLEPVTVDAGEAVGAGPVA